jgi:glycosyltransferase involved in cell wall biosynthesis
MEKDILISFIIPAYNAEKTIAYAVRSLLDIPQSEIIIVENGSTDNTEQILRELEEYDNVAVYISDKGVSNARNTGMQHASGKWIAFVDADDYITDVGRKVLIEDARDASWEIYAYGHVAGQRKHPITDRIEVFPLEKLNYCREQMLKNPTRYMQVWAKLFRRDIIEKNHLLFDTELPLAEDSDFTLRYMKYVTSICWKPEQVYHYTLNPASVMHSQTVKKEKAYIFAMEKTSKAIQDENEVVKQAYDTYIMMHFNILMVRETFCYSDYSFKKKCHDMKRLCKTPVFQNAVDGIRISECKSGRMLPVLFMKMKLYCLAGIIYELRVKQNEVREKRRISK